MFENLKKARESKKKIQELRSQRTKNKVRNVEITNLKKKLSSNNYHIDIESFSTRSNSPQTSPVPTPISIPSINQKNKTFTKSIIQDLKRNFEIAPPARRYSKRTKIFAMGILLISFTAFNYLRSFLPLPSRQALQKNFQADLSLKTEYLTDVKNIPIIVADYREREKISETEKIQAVLAIDAISFNPILKIDKNGNVIGTTKEEIISSYELLQLEKNFSEFEKFVSERKELLISDAFVVQVQPVLMNYSSFVVHISPSSQGKGTNKEVQLLIEIQEKLKDENIFITSFAFDGDSYYYGLHEKFFKSYELLVKTDMSFLNFSHINETNVISDPLHLLKRGRYRLVSRKVHAGLTSNSQLINIGVLESVLKLPKITFSSQRITKMHDDLAINLFSFHSLNHLIEAKNYSYLTYFLPLSLMNIALSEKQLVNIERINFLEVAFFYCFLLKEETYGNDQLLPQNKNKGNSELRMFDDRFIMELTNTLFSILSHLYKINGIVNLNRLSSNPLEHTFGLIRMKSRYSHTYQKAMKSLGKVQLLKKITNIIKEGSVIGRKSYYGQTIYNNVTTFQYSINMDPRDLAVCLHMYFDLPIRYRDIICSDMDSLLELSNEISENFLNLIKSIYLRCYPHERKNKLTTNTLTKLKGNILNRFENKERLSKQTF